MCSRQRIAELRPTAIAFISGLAARRCDDQTTADIPRVGTPHPTSQWWSRTSTIYDGLLGRDLLDRSCASSGTAPQLCANLKTELDTPSQPRAAGDRMTDPKTPVERLRESLRLNAEDVSKWPQWMREAVSTARVFEDARAPDSPARPRDRQR